MTSITIERTIHKPVELVWQTYNEPTHMVKWNFASDDWYCPSAKSDFRVGGYFTAKMATKDNSFAFDFQGIYDDIITDKLIKYHMADGRYVLVKFDRHKTSTHISVKFDLESENDPELQKAGWQAILNNFKSYTESLS